MSKSTALVPFSRSRVANGVSLFVEADGRSAWARRFRGLVETYSAHIGGHPSAPEAALIRRIAALDVEAERMEGMMADGHAVDVDSYNRIAGGQRRLLAQLGFKETKRDNTPSLADIIARHA